MAEQRVIQTVEDVTPEILAAAEEAEEWFQDRPIDWDEFWDRFDTPEFYMKDMLSPAALKIERHIRKIRKERG